MKQALKVLAVTFLVGLLIGGFHHLVKPDKKLASQLQELRYLDQIDRLLEENRTALEQADRTTFGMDYKDKAEQEKEWQKAYATIIKNEKRIWKIREKMWELKP